MSRFRRFVIQSQFTWAVFVVWCGLFWSQLVEDVTAGPVLRRRLRYASFALAVLVVISMAFVLVGCAVSPPDPIAPCGCTSQAAVSQAWVRDDRVLKPACYCFAGRGICTCPEGTGCVCEWRRGR